MLFEDASVYLVGIGVGASRFKTSGKKKKKKVFTSIYPACACSSIHLECGSWNASAICDVFFEGQSWRCRDPPPMRIEIPSIPPSERHIQRRFLYWVFVDGCSVLCWIRKPGKPQL